MFSARPAPREVRERAARLLEARGLHDAFTLFSASGAWRAASRLIENHAEDLLSRGREVTLREWITALPQDKVQHPAVVAVLAGISLVAADQASARAHLEAASEAFVAGGDILGSGARRGWNDRHVLFRVVELPADAPWVDSSFRCSIACSFPGGRAARTQGLRQPARGILTRRRTWPRATASSPA
ncbi:MAG: hypothetical protein IPK20_25710 [Betaproteobacteria bacterium]|nr:hypothetical protein [Betaproteobacteria bacterium]